jgi:lysophospholipase L1-like esterase
MTMELRADRFGESITVFGRTLFDRNEGIIFFNWTGAGFELTFRGTKVEAVLDGRTDFYPTEGENVPWLAVFLDGARLPARIFDVQDGARAYTLFESPAPETHTVRVVKRSENTKGRVGIKSLSVAGDILQPKAPARRPRLEFVGDSITCGFGNETDETGMFKTALENGFKAYGAVAAELLDAEYHSICISGIPLCNSYNENFSIRLPDFSDFRPPRRAMEDYYAYTDRFQQEASGLTSGFEEWDFKKFRPDAIIVNLGTNDAFRCKASGNDPEEERHFEKRYREFLYLLRRLNGPGPVIGCTLGSMDYYLYDNILRAADAYKAETGDSRVFCCKFGGIFLWEEGIGALDHPSAKTHERMGKELACVLKNWI